MQSSEYVVLRHPHHFSSFVALRLSVLVLRKPVLRIDKVSRGCARFIDGDAHPMGAETGREFVMSVSITLYRDYGVRLPRSVTQKVNLDGKMHIIVGIVIQMEYLLIEARHEVGI